MGECVEAHVVWLSRPVQNSLLAHCVQTTGAAVGKPVWNSFAWVAVWLLLFVALETEPRISCVLDKCSPTELDPQPIVPALKCLPFLV